MTVLWVEEMVLDENRGWMVDPAVSTPSAERSEGSAAILRVTANRATSKV
jgi:hypothetical protein